ncbi:MAG: BrnA antitoxin family protein [Proteobacteria bacterium]|nr:BrnA antitoxin family protein [Pseudomonadota bacterium]
MNGNKHATPIVWIDPDDAPELDDAFFARADEYVGEKLVRRGRPKAAVTKEAVKLRLDADLLAALRATGDGWQTRINDMLRASMHLAGRV